jgi:hypothetical protein
LLITGGDGLFTMIVNGTASLAEALSVRVTVNVNGPVVVGVPVSDPSLPKVSPGGSAPAVTAQLRGRAPPVSANWYP